MSHKTAVIIPARFNSKRFIGKSLEMIDEYNVIQSVYKRAIQAKLPSRVIVATDDQRIVESVKNIGGEAIMTQKNHKNGTSRIAEIGLNLKAFKYFINVQGDEPFVEPIDIDKVARMLMDTNVDIVSLMKRCSENEKNDPNCVKVVTDLKDKALYFSRTGIPFSSGSETTSFKHIGIYGFNAAVLQEIVNLPISPLEQSEKLEQLRWLENGYVIQMIETQFESVGIDVPEDLIKARAFHKTLI